MILELEVVLKFVKPPVRRILQLDSNLTFADLHEILQIAFEWDGYHLHQFKILKRDGRKMETVIEPDSEDNFFATGNELDEAEERLGKWLSKPGDEALYWYDFGADWMHRIKVKKILEKEPGLEHPRCVKASGEAPEEDTYAMEYDASGGRTNKQLALDVNDMLSGFESGRSGSVEAEDLEDEPGMSLEDLFGNIPEDAPVEVNKQLNLLRAILLDEPREQNVADHLLPESGKQGPIYHLDIIMEGVKTPVRRKIMMGADRTFMDLASTLGVAFRWEELFPHRFIVNRQNGKEKETEIQPAELPIDLFESGGWVAVDVASTEPNEEEEKLEDWLIRTGDTVTCLRGNRENQVYVIKLVSVSTPDPSLNYPLCTEAAGKGPEWADTEGNFLEAGEDLTELINGDLSLAQTMMGFFEDSMDAGFSENLLEVSKEIGELMPWKHIQEKQPIMITDVEDEDKEPVWASVIGHGGGLCGIVVHPGLKAYKRQHVLWREHGLQDLPEDLDAVAVYFCDRGQLEEEDYRFIKDQGYSFRGKKKWPVFRKYTPGLSPKRPDELDLPDLAIAMEVAGYLMDEEPVLVRSAGPGEMFSVGLEIFDFKAEIIEIPGH